MISVNTIAINQYDLSTSLNCSQALYPSAGDPCRHGYLTFGILTTFGFISGSTLVVIFYLSLFTTILESTEFFELTFIAGKIISFCVAYRLQQAK